MTQVATQALRPHHSRPRQFVNFAFYKLDPAFRRLHNDQKLQASDELTNVLSNTPAGMLFLSYSLIGLRGR